MFSTAGARLYLGDEMDGGWLDAAAFSHIASWVEIGSTTNLGRSGFRTEVERVALPICDEPEKPALVRKDAVTLDGGTMIVFADLSHTDAGQMLAWASVGLTRAVRLILPPPPTGPTPTRLFVALVAAVDEQWNEANNAMQLMIELELDSNVVRTTL